MSYGEKDETDFGGAYELPTKAHYRRNENAFTFERRTGQKPQDSRRLIPLRTALMNQIRRFCRLNAPTYAEICYALADVLAFMECNPECVVNALAEDIAAREKFLADPNSSSDLAGAAIALSEAMADAHMDYGLPAAERALSIVAGVVHKNRAELETIVAAGKGNVTDEPEDFQFTGPFDFGGKPITEESISSAIDELNAKLDRANADGQEDVANPATKEPYTVRPRPDYQEPVIPSPGMTARRTIGIGATPVPINVIRTRVVSPEPTDEPCVCGKFHPRR